tara:strand:- start:2984 stop:3157 length:174 start_codon:yes stop_codon:yes gene_type:complete
MLNIEHLQWLEKTLLASKYKEKLIDLGYEDFVKDVEKKTTEEILEYRRSQVKLKGGK